MIYLDNAATTFPKPECVYNRVNAIQRTIAVNVGRGSYSAASEAMQIVDETRMLLSSLVGAERPDCIVLTPSATIAANEIILGLEWDEYKTVYVTPFEHNAIARPLHSICEKFNIEIRFIPFNAETQGVDVEELRRVFALNPPDYVFINQVSNVTGVIIPVDQICGSAKEYGATVIVDGSQSVGLIPINLKDSDVDFLVFAGHKNLYASWGIGGFISNTKYPLQPVLAGGTGSDSLNLNMSTLIPGGFELGSPNIIAIASLNESLKWLQQIGLNNIEKRKQCLTTRLIEGLRRCEALLYTPAAGIGHTSVVSFNLPGYEANEVGTILSEDFDIAVRTGYHCAPFVHELIRTVDVHGTVRVSVSYFNSESDVDALIAAVEDIMGDPL
ncbi:aminotransferase class V-fold PLP-dependent enzyme [Anaeromassilibacillus senegalensis]|uniref:aminotransferase class V-fold PLP-dependent enzyme n=1 Tax=Anaeromassilibacillus senegalensis TaxID=1673717 RepID=UPI0006824391|nr:aminotransferase class V-fold PLP-dependent enzyme [Anaeromassilibacillus senegalensis]